MVIFIYGEDFFRSLEKLKEIRNKFLEKDQVGSGLSVFDFEEKAEISEIINSASTQNLFKSKRLVIIKNLFASGKKEDKELFLEFLKKNRNLWQGQENIFVFWEKISEAKSEPLFKFLIEKGKSQNFQKLSGVKLEQWICKRIQQFGNNCGIEKEAMEKLISFCGENTLILNNEIQKLVNFSEGKEIDEKSVGKLVKSNLDENVFETIDAIARKEKKKALKLVHSHLEKGEDPFYIFSMFVYQFRNLLKVSGAKEEVGPNDQQIAKFLKMHPFVVRKSLSQLHNFSQENLGRIYHKLSNLDILVKTGKMDIKLALDKFIVEI